jgi:hypothetical protein
MKNKYANPLLMASLQKQNKNHQHLRLNTFESIDHAESYLPYKLVSTVVTDFACKTRSLFKVFGSFLFELNTNSSVFASRLFVFDWHILNHSVVFQSSPYDSQRSKYSFTSKNRRVDLSSFIFSFNVSNCLLSRKLFLSFGTKKKKKIRR